MPSDWRRFCQTAKYSITDNCVLVSTSPERSHRVRVFTEGNSWRLAAIVNRRDLRIPLDELRLYIWRRNRTVDLMGFRIDTKNHIIGEAWIPMGGTAAPEFRTILDAVARESDLLEFALTGRDIE